MNVREDMDRAKDPAPEGSESVVSSTLRATLKPPRTERTSPLQQQYPRSAVS